MQGGGAVHVLYRPRFVCSMPCACWHVTQPSVFVGALLTLKKGLVEPSYSGGIPESTWCWLGLSCTS
jgi:hypothetical protein